MQLPGFEPGSRTWQARIITKLYYNCSFDKVRFSLLKRAALFNIVFNQKVCRCAVDEKLREIMSQKINAALSNVDEIQTIVKSLGKSSSENSTFSYGIIIGRLYNSFYYQCRRILKRSPTEQEFLEFLSILKQKENEILEKLEFNKK